MRFLLFMLYAPMASFGEIAVGERRMGWARPGRSAVLGLVAAARGIDRTDEAGHQQLETGLYFAVRTDAAGHPMIDYQTTQTPKSRKGRTFATRREELETDNVHTVLSRREWRTDTCYTVALWPRPGRAVDLDEIADALQRPRYVLYVGRKSAPLGLPLNAGIVEADTFMDAFDARLANDPERIVYDRIGATRRGAIAFDDDAPGAPAETRVERRRDGIVSRVRWQFADRLERVFVPRSGEA